jgi:hypothetical protein
MGTGKDNTCSHTTVEQLPLTIALTTSGNNSLGKYTNGHLSVAAGQKTNSHTTKS